MVYSVHQVADIVKIGGNLPPVQYRAPDTPTSLKYISLWTPPVPHGKAVLSIAKGQQCLVRRPDIGLDGWDPLDLFIVQLYHSSHSESLLYISDVKYVTFRLLNLC